MNCLPRSLATCTIALIWGLLCFHPGYSQSVYEIRKVKKPVRIDGVWDKKPWKKVRAVEITHRMGDTPRFTPRTSAKLTYDKKNLYLIFRVEDRFVKSTITHFNGSVSTDSCVEFFFAPDEDEPLRYFNLEINAGGTPLIYYVTRPWTDYVKLDSIHIARIDIAHSLPRIVDPEIEKDTTWTIECKIPLSMLQEYGRISLPRTGVRWKANFYKTGSKTSNPHYFTWAPVTFPRPNFHLPEFFGTLIFQ